VPINRHPFCMKGGNFHSGQEPTDFPLRSLQDASASQALDGRKGTPISRVRQHSHYFNLCTDKEGNAMLVLSPDSFRRVQVWIDGMTLCPSRPNSASFSVDEVISKWLLAPNDCGNLRISNTPGQLRAFVRPATFREQILDSGGRRSAHCDIYLRRSLSPGSGCCCATQTPRRRSLASGHFSVSFRHDLCSWRRGGPRPSLYPLELRSQDRSPAFHHQR